MRKKDSSVPQNNRRKRLRFPLSTELRYQIVRRGRGEPVGGVGQVQDMCSQGLAFLADKPLELGAQLKVSVQWPAQLDRCLLRLVFEGAVLRTRGNLIVVNIAKSEFRTAGISAAAREEIAAFAGAMESMSAPEGHTSR